MFFSQGSLIIIIITGHQPQTRLEPRRSHPLQIFLSSPSVALREFRHTVNDGWHCLRSVKREDCFADGLSASYAFLTLALRGRTDMCVHNLVKELSLFQSGHFQLQYASVLNAFCPNRSLCRGYRYLRVALLHSDRAPAAPSDSSTFLPPEFWMLLNGCGGEYWWFDD